MRNNGTVIVVSADSRRPGGTGKMTLNFFLPPFREALADFGLSLRYYEKPRECLFGRTIAKAVAIIPIYNEEATPPNGASFLARTNVRMLELRAARSYPTVRFVHPLRVARMISDKSRAHTILSAAGVPMPKLADRANARKIISLSRTGTALNAVLSDEKALDRSRHNTEFIDTTQSFGGNSYYISLRAMCVGPEVAGIYVRARDVRENNPSVHTKNTPTDPRLLNHLYETVVEPRRHKIVELCKRVGNRLGLGFYAHDILPEASTDNIFLCETGFKFDNRTTRATFAPIADKLTFSGNFTEPAVRNAAHIFANAVLAADRRPQTTGPLSISA